MALWRFTRKTQHLLDSAGWFPERCVPYTASSIYTDDAVLAKVTTQSVAMSWESGQSSVSDDGCSRAILHDSISNRVLQTFGGLTIRRDKQSVFAFQPDFEFGPLTEPIRRQIHSDDVALEIAIWKHVEEKLKCRIVPVAWIQGCDTMSIAIDEFGVVYEACWQMIFGLETVDAAVGRTADCIESFLNFWLDPSESTRRLALAKTSKWIANLTISTV